MTRLLFLAPNIHQITGGTKAIFGFANAMAARGHDVHITHQTVLDPEGRLVGHPFTDPQQVDWYPIDSAITQRIDEMPEAEVVFSWDGQIPNPRHGMPVVWIQAFGVTADWLQEPVFAAACPKVCTSRWLRRVAVAKGVPEHQAVWVPYGLEHERYRVTESVEQRGPVVALLYNNHFKKRPTLAVEALVSAKNRRPDLEALVFGNTGLCAPLPDWMEWHPDPPWEELVALYNRASVFLSPSAIEGFGLAALEAMACGCALVSTRNGGSDDYAVDGDTAVCCDGEADAMANGIVSLLDDPHRRVAIARSGMRTASSFRWARSGELLDQLLEAYLADPQWYRHPTGPAQRSDAELLDPSCP